MEKSRCTSMDSRENMEIAFSPIGLSVVQPDRIEGGELHIWSVDGPTAVRTGWLEKVGKTVASRKSDDRFK